MKEIEELEAAYIAAANAFLEAIAGVCAVRDIRDTAILDLGLASDNVEVAINVRDSARFHMSNAARELNSARNYKKEK